MDIWSIILKTNTFNFIIMVGIFWFVFKKFNLSDMLSKEIEKIKNSIVDSKNIKEQSKTELKNAYKEASNVNSEINKIKLNTQENISNLEKTFENETLKQKESIKNNTLKTVSTKEKETIKKLEDKTKNASIYVAKAHIQNLLSKNPEYHQHFIDESIKDLEKELSGLIK